MPLIGDFVDLIAPVAPSTLGAEVFERFQSEPNTLALAVVDDGGRPLASSNATPSPCAWRPNSDAPFTPVNRPKA